MFLPNPTGLLHQKKGMIKKKLHCTHSGHEGPECLQNNNEWEFKKDFEKIVLKAKSNKWGPIHIALKPKKMLRGCIVCSA